MHPRFGVEREYAVRVLGTLDDEQRARLLEGIEIDGQRAAMRSIEDGGGEGANHWYRVVITEGRNREVRKLFEAVGMAVSRLIRIRYGCVVLPRGLRRGVWVDLPAERPADACSRMVGGPRAARRAASSDNGNGRPNNRNKRNRGRDNRGPRDRGRERAAAAPREGGQPPLQQTGAAPPRRRRRQPAISRRYPTRCSRPSIAAPFARRGSRAARSPRTGRSPIRWSRPTTSAACRSRGGLGGGGGGGGGRKGGKGAGGGERQPDPMQTSVGYIGADAFHKQMSGGGGGGGGGGRGGRRRR